MIQIFGQALKYLRATPSRWAFMGTLLLTDRPVVLVLTMGKVGSSSVYASLKHAGWTFRVAHIHFLSDDLESVKKKHRDAGFFIGPPHVTQSEGLQSLLPRIDNRRINVITIIREPVGFMVSDFFQNPYFYADEGLDLQRLNSADYVIDFLNSVVLNKSSRAFGYWSTWMQREIDSVFDCSIGSSCFERSNNYMILETKKARILVLKKECLSEAIVNVIPMFLAMEGGMSALNRNDRSKKSSIYREVLERIAVPIENLNEIYSNQLVRKFYDASEVDSFLRKWAGFDKVGSASSITPLVQCIEDKGEIH